MKSALFVVPAFVVAGVFICASGEATPLAPSGATIAAPAASAVLPVRHRYYRHYQTRRSGSEAADTGTGSGTGVIKPGEWEFSAQLQTQTAPPAAAAEAKAKDATAAMPSGALKSTYRSCIAADKAIPAAFGPGCTIDAVQQQGGQVTWSMTCTNRQNAVRSDGAAEYRGETMQGTMVSHLPAAGPGKDAGGKLTDLTQLITGRYIGSCPQLAQNPATPIIPPRATTAPGAGSGSSTQWVEPPTSAGTTAPVRALSSPAAPSSAGAESPGTTASAPRAAEVSTPAVGAAPAAYSAAGQTGAAPAAPSGTAAQAPTTTSETATAAIPRVQRSRRYAAPRRYYHRRYYSQGYYAAGAPNLLALPFAAIHGLLGQ